MLIKTTPEHRKKGKLPNIGGIILMPKSDKDCMHIHIKENYRSFLSISIKDKILNKLLACKIMYRDDMRFIPRMQNEFRNRTLIYIKKSKERKYMIISIDFKMAFIEIQQSLLIKTLNKLI